MRRMPVTVFIVLFAVSAGFADFKYTEKSKITGGSIMGAVKFAGAFSKDAKQMTQGMNSTVSFKGNKMRREDDLGNAEIYDLDGRRIIHIDTRHRTRLAAGRDGEWSRQCPDCSCNGRVPQECFQHDWVPTAAIRERWRYRHGPAGTIRKQSTILAFHARWSNRERHRRAFWEKEEERRRAGAAGLCQCRFKTSFSRQLTHGHDA